MIDAVYEAHPDLCVVVGHQHDVKQLLAVGVQLPQPSVHVHQRLCERRQRFTSDTRVLCQHQVTKTGPVLPHVSFSKVTEILKRGTSTQKQPNRHHQGVLFMYDTGDWSCDARPGRKMAKNEIRATLPFIKNCLKI